MVPDRKKKGGEEKFLQFQQCFQELLQSCGVAVEEPDLQVQGEGENSGENPGARQARIDQGLLPGLEFAEKEENQLVLQPETKSETKVFVVETKAEVETDAKVEGKEENATLEGKTKVLEEDTMAEVETKLKLKEDAMAVVETKVMEVKTKVSEESAMSVVESNLEVEEEAMTEMEMETEVMEVQTKEEDTMAVVERKLEVQTMAEVENMAVVEVERNQKTVRYHCYGCEKEMPGVAPGPSCPACDSGNNSGRRRDSQLGQILPFRRNTVFSTSCRGQVRGEVARKDSLLHMYFLCIEPDPNRTFTCIKATYPYAP